VKKKKNKRRSAR